MSTVESRLVRLEKSAARWRLAAVALGLLLVAGVSMGQITMVGGGPGGGTMRVPNITADKCTVNDALVLNNADGNARLTIANVNDGAAIELKDKKGNLLLSISSDGKTANILIQDATGKKLFAAP